MKRVFFGGPVVSYWEKPSHLKGDDEYHSICPPMWMMTGPDVHRPSHVFLVLQQFPQLRAECVYVAKMEWTEVSKEVLIGVVRIAEYSTVVIASLVPIWQAREVQFPFIYLACIVDGAVAWGLGDIP